MITAASVVARSDDAITAPPGEELATMDIGRTVVPSPPGATAGAYFVLDAIDTGVWSLLETPTRAGQVLDARQTRYAVTPERCRTDVVALLERMHAKGLVRIDG